MLGRIGGLLILVAIVGLGVALLVGLTGDRMSVPERSTGGLVMAAALIAAGAGFVLLGLAGPAPLDGRVVRGALGATGVGFVIVTLAAPATMDSPWVIALLIGGALAWLGAIVLILALLARRGLPRRIGALLVGGIVAAAVGQSLLVDEGGGAALPAPLGWLVIAVGLGMVVAGLAGLGSIGLGRIGEASASAPAPAAGDPT